MSMATQLRGNYTAVPTQEFMPVERNVIRKGNETVFTKLFQCCYRPRSEPKENIDLTDAVVSRQLARRTVVAAPASIALAIPASLRAESRTAIAPPVQLAGASVEGAARAPIPEVCAAAAAPPAPAPAPSVSSSALAQQWRTILKSSGDSLERVARARSMIAQDLPEETVQEKEEYRLRKEAAEAGFKKEFLLQRALRRERVKKEARSVPEQDRLTSLAYKTYYYMKCKGCTPQVEDEDGAALHLPPTGEGIILGLDKVHLPVENLSPTRLP